MVTWGKNPKSNKRSELAKNKIPPYPKFSSALLQWGANVVLSPVRSQALGRGHSHMFHTKGQSPAPEAYRPGWLSSLFLPLHLPPCVIQVRRFTWSALALKIESRGTRTMQGTQESFDLLVGHSDTKQGSFERLWGPQWWPRGNARNGTCSRENACWP